MSQRANNMAPACGPSLAVLCCLLTLLLGAAASTAHKTSLVRTEVVGRRPKARVSEREGEQLPVMPTPAKNGSFAPPPARSSSSTARAGSHRHKRRAPRHVAAPPLSQLVSYPAALPSAWCVANSSVDPDTLQDAMEVACAFGGADCTPVQPGGPCFQPNCLPAHASYVFNSYWQRTKHLGGSCTFDGAAVLTWINPSYEACNFELRD